MGGDTVAKVHLQCTIICSLHGRHLFCHSAEKVIISDTLEWSGYGSGLVCNLLQLRYLSVSCRPAINNEINISVYLKKAVQVLTTLPVSLIPIDQCTN